MSVVNSSLASMSAVVIVGVLSACVQLGATEEDVKSEPVAEESGFVQCNTPRPEICYELHQPVCATRDNGLRCVTTPCFSTEEATYANDCKACADPAVQGFVSGGACQGNDLSVNLLQKDAL